ncbi:NAD(P)H-binding protein [Micromonospora sp. NPDC023737]|uniref:NmrA family NAD(P)-binding protein n=1 Tax=unclassified Micromonospora TaxID=2617518 RepID=UPI003401625D
MNELGEILVVGGTGKTGRGIVRRLRAAGRPVRSAARAGGDVHFDLVDPTTWAPALDGVTAVYLVAPNPVLTPEGVSRIQEFVSEAAAVGVRRMVMLSGIGLRVADDDHPFRAVEAAVRRSGAEWTFLRPTWFAQNFGESIWLRSVLDGALHLPCGDGLVSFIDAEDISEVAVATLTEDGHNGQIYELTGPRAIGFEEALDLIGKATGRTIRYIDITPEAYLQRLLDGGMPPQVARRNQALRVAIRDGLDGSGALTDGVERVLGRPPRTFEEYVARTAAEGRWTG